jgi:hypothetical protein
MKERGSSSVVFWAAAVLAGLAWTGARADIEDKNAAKEALKAVTTTNKPAPPTASPSAGEPTDSAEQQKQGDAATASPFVELTAASYETVVKKDAPVYLALPPLNAWLPGNGAEWRVYYAA